MKAKHLQLLLEEFGVIGTYLAQADKANVAMIKMLSDRLTRIETAQNETLKCISDVTGYLAKYLKEQEVNELDRGQTASAMYGLIKRLDQLEKRLFKTKEPA